MPIGTREVHGDIYGVILNGSGTEIGKFRVIASSGLDLWEWYGTPFPTSGFEVKMTNTTGSISPTLQYQDYAFSTNNVVPSTVFGSSNVFVITQDGDTVGWIEIQTGGNPSLNWWSNGSNLNASRRMVVGVGDTLGFSPGSFPASKEYPLTDVQTPK
ncbi:MAG: hypothetical protein H6736_16090 [Alphaproteobacteria bacterium]|nr:hypothetical protein [Alphaproteobacteria bacterium]